MSAARAAFVTAVVAVLVAVPLSLAQAGEDDQSPRSTATKLKKLKKQVTALQGQVEGLAAKPGASGPAGGDLSGSYPNPAIGSNSVTGAKVADGALGSADLADNSVTGADIDDSTLSLTGAELVDNSLTGVDIDESTLSLPDEAITFSKRQSAGTETFETIFQGNGLTLEGHCSGGTGSLEFRFDHDAGVLLVAGTFDGAPPPPFMTSSSGVTSDQNTVGAGVNSTTDARVTFRRDSDGKVITLSLMAISANALLTPVTDCLWAGTAIVT